MLEKPTMVLESLTPPEKLSDSEQAELVKKIDDPRLRIDEDLEHFTIHIADRIIHVPKRKIIHIQTISGGIESIKIGDYIQKVIAENDVKP